MLVFLKKLWDMRSILPPLKEVLSENGVGSYSRYTGFAIVMATIGWVSYLVIRTHALPDLSGPALFIASGQSSYGLNQMKHVAAAARAVRQINQSSGPTIIQQTTPDQAPATPDATPTDGEDNAAKS